VKPPWLRHPAASIPTPKPRKHPIFSTFAAKREKVAKFLIDEDLADEAEPHRKAAEKALLEAAAIEGPTA
jgi:hypothetical protein